MQKLDFHQNKYFSVFLFKVSALLSNHTVCKIGLNVHLIHAQDSAFNKAVENEPKPRLKYLPFWEDFK
jgi:hypothetical protein